MSTDHALREDAWSSYPTKDYSYMYTQWTCHGFSGQNTLQIGADGESRLDPSVVYLLATTTTWQVSTCRHRHILELFSGLPPLDLGLPPLGLTWACPHLTWACPHLTWACKPRAGPGDAGYGSLHEPKIFNYSKIAIGPNARAVIRTYACWIKQQQFNHSLQTCA